MSHLTVVVLNVFEEYDEAIGLFEEQVGAAVHESELDKGYYVEVDDISTIDAVAEEMMAFAHQRPDFSEEAVFVILPTLSETPDEAHLGLIAFYREVGAMVIMACTEEGRGAPEFEELWDRYELNAYNPWHNIADYVRWRIIPKGQA